VNKTEAAQILGVEEKSVTHVEGNVNGQNLCLKQVPGLYSRADAEAIAKARAEAKAQREQEKAEKQEAARKAVERHEPTGTEADDTLSKLQASVDQAQSK